jgi:hypothetical protein
LVVLLSLGIRREGDIGCKGAELGDPISSSTVDDEHGVIRTLSISVVILTPPDLNYPER